MQHYNKQQQQKQDKKNISSQTPWRDGAVATFEIGQESGQLSGSKLTLLSRDHSALLFFTKKKNLVTEDHTEEKRKKNQTISMKSSKIINTQRQL